MILYLFCEAILDSGQTHYNNIIIIITISVHNITALILYNPQNKIIVKIACVHSLGIFTKVVKYLRQLLCLLLGIDNIKVHNISTIYSLQTRSLIFGITTYRIINNNYRYYSRK